MNTDQLCYTPENDSVLEFFRWKKTRKKMIQLIGPRLLNYNENELISVFNLWESSAKNAFQSEQNSVILGGFLNLALFFYFRRSISRINKFIPMLTQFVRHPNRCICKTAMHLLTYLSSHSRENINFLHDFVSVSWLKFDDPESSFRSLVILDEAFYLTPALVRSFVIPHFTTIVSLCFDDDFDMQDIALQVIYHHTCQPRDGIYLTNLFEICYSHLTPEPSNANRGALFIARMLVKMHLTSDQLNSLLLMLTTFLKLKDEIVTTLCGEIILSIFEQETPISSHLMNHLCSSIFNAIRYAPDSPRLFAIFVRVIDKIPKNKFPINSILEFVNEIFVKRKVALRYGYSFLLTALKQQPTVQFSFTVPFDKNLCKEYLSILKMRPLLILDSQKQLQEVVENGLKSTTNEEIVLALKVARICSSMLWGSSEELISRIYSYQSSSCIAIRHQVIRIIGQFQKQHQAVVSAALFDSSPIIRKTALKLLFKQENLNQYSMLPDILNDESFEVTSVFLDIMNNIYHTNPMLFAPFVYQFDRKLIRGYLMSPDLQTASQSVLLFPKFATLIVTVDDDLAQSLSMFCIYVLRRGKTEKPPLLTDVYQNNNILNLPGNEKDKNLQLQVFRLVNMTFLNICDINLLNSLEILKEKVDYREIIPLFKAFLSERRKNEVIEVALKTLTSFVPYLKLPLDEELIEILFDVLNQTSNHKVIRASFILFGTAGIIRLPPSIPKASSSFTPHTLTEYSNEFVQKQLFEALCNSVPTQLPSFFTVATTAIIAYPDVSKKYLGILIPEYIKLLSITENDHIITSQLIQITKEMTTFMTPYLETFQNILLNKLDDELWVYFCIVLSYYLKDNFIPYSSVLYHKSISYLPSVTSNKLAQRHLKFLSFSIIFQHQPLSCFLKLCEELISKQFKKIVIIELIRIFQNFEDARPSSSWFARIFTKVPSDPTAIQLMYSIAFYGEISYNLLVEILDTCKIADPNFTIFETPERTPPSFMIRKTVKIKANVKPVLESKENVSNLVSNIIPPINGNIDKWVQDFVLLVVTCSPSVGIRACGDLVKQSEQFRNEILTAAFLTCWVVLPEIEKQQVLDVFKFIIDTFHPLPVSLWRMIDIFDICQISFSLPLNDMAKASRFPAQALHYWKSDFIRTNENVEYFLEQLLNLGLIDSAKGVLKKSKQYLKNFDCWYEKLGDWSEALENCEKDNFVGLVRSYGNLQQWARIIALEPHFESMSIEEKKTCSVWFGWAFYFLGDIQKAESFIQFFPQNFDKQRFYFECIMKIIHNEFDAARKKIIDVFKYISTDTSMFDGSNVKIAEERLTMSQNLIELLEVIDCKSKQIEPSLWKSRSPLNSRSDGFIDLTNIRSLILSKEEQLNLAITLASSLRKTRNYGQLAGAFFRMIRIGSNPMVLFEGIKMLWCQNKKAEAIRFLSILVTSYSSAKIKANKLIYSTSAPNLNLPNSPPSILNSSSNSSLDTAFTNSNTSPKGFHLRKETKVFWKDLNKIISEDDVLDELSSKKAGKKIGKSKMISRKNTTIFESIKPSPDTSTDSPINLTNNETPNNENHLQNKQEALVTLKKLYSEMPETDLNYLPFHDKRKDENKLAHNSLEYAQQNPVSDEFHAKAKRILTCWIIEEQPQTMKSLLHHCKTLKLCSQQLSKDVKTIQALALLENTIIDKAVIDNSQKMLDIDKYVSDCISNFLKIIHMSSEPNLSALLLLLSMLMQCANCNIMSDETITALKNLPQSLLSKALPQFINLLSHKCVKLRETVKSILLNFGETRFQKLFYSLNIGRLSSESLKSKISNEIFEILRPKFPKLAEDLLIFIKDLNNASISLLEVWKFGIEKAKRYHDLHDDDQVIIILSELFNRLDNPICDLDRHFKRIIEQNLDRLRYAFESFAQTRQKDVETFMWTALYKLYDVLFKKVNQTAMIMFSTVAPDLANRKDLKIAIPGTQGLAQISSFDPMLKVFETAAHPRFLTMIDYEGKKHNFLLKGNCDVRLDFRIMQFFLLLNTLLKSNRVTTNLSVTQYSIVPLTKESGLIWWVENSESLFQIISKFKKHRVNEDRIIKNDYCNNGYTMTSFQLYELYQQVTKENDSDEIDQYIWLMAPTSSIWLKKNINFVTSSALMSIAGYLIGLGDRHPNNILLQNTNGKITHIDFEDSFETTMNRIKYPEKVPFRLTKMIVNALDGGTPFGLFKTTCEDVLSLLKEAKQTVLAQFHLFTLDSTIMNNPKFNGKSIMKRIREKLEGKDLFILKEETPSAEIQVEKLINVSSNPELYATQFVGWCPFW